MTARQKSKKGLVVWLVVGGALWVMLVAFIVVFVLSSAYGTKAARLAGEANRHSVKTTVSKFFSDRAIVASSTNDFKAVCSGSTISNAAKYVKKGAAKIATFSQSPKATDSWVHQDVGSDKSYTKTNGNPTKIDTVACLHEIRDSKMLARSCGYQEDDRSVSVKYYSVRYKLSYYEAKTGKRISDGGIIEAPASECPGFMAYDPATLTAFAAPDMHTLDIAHMSFVAR